MSKLYLHWAVYYNKTISLLSHDRLAKKIFCTTLNNQAWEVDQSKNWTKTVYDFEDTSRMYGVMMSILIPPHRYDPVMDMNSAIGSFLVQTLQDNHDKVSNASYPSDYIQFENETQGNYTRFISRGRFQSWPFGSGFSTQEHTVFFSFGLQPKKYSDKLMGRIRRRVSRCFNDDVVKVSAEAVVCTGGTELIIFCLLTFLISNRKY